MPFLPRRQGRSAPLYKPNEMVSYGFMFYRWCHASFQTVLVVRFGTAPNLMDAMDGRIQQLSPLQNPELFNSHRRVV